jgi:hypothetical protein
VTLKAFLFLFVVTMVAVVGAALIAEILVAPGFERGIVIAVLAGLVVFPAARWAEYRGWIKGAWSPGGDLRKQQEARKEQEKLQAREQVSPPAADEAQAPAAQDPATADAGTARQPAAADGEAPMPPAGPRPSPGDPR